MISEIAGVNKVPENVFASPHITPNTSVMALTYAFASPITSVTFCPVQATSAQLEASIVGT